MDNQQIQGILGLGLPSGGTSGSEWFDSFALPLFIITYCCDLVMGVGLFHYFYEKRAT